MTLRTFTLALCLLGATVVSVAASGRDTAEAATSPPVAAVSGFHAAIKRGDADAVATLLMDDAVIYEQGGAETSKAEYVTGHLPGDIAYSAGMSDTITGRRSEVSGPFALVMTQGRTTGTHDGKPVDRLTTETMVLKRVKGVWRVAHIHWSSRAARA